ncbi:MAG: zinc-dependent peptidase [Cyclobacteriaceae bacterium]|nr:zinc-dependent peptidase [Cyclobacteriaceae bacterium]
MAIPLLILAIVALATIVYLPYSILKAIILHFYKDHINRYLIFVDLKGRYKKILWEYCLYYRRLNRKDQRIFERRVAKFMAMKEFVPRGGLEKVTDHMKTLVSATAIKLTFGLPSIYFEHFWRILIYPDVYYSNISQQYHQGEVNTKGFIMLSWPNFIEGIIDREDGKNLGLHEMAHALRIENSIRNQEYDFLDFDALMKFDVEAKKEMVKINDQRSTFYRSYAGVNEQEFFAVTIENFFERPALLKEYHPGIYLTITQMLQQDPLVLFNG